MDGILYVKKKKKRYTMICYFSDFGSKFQIIYIFITDKNNLSKYKIQFRMGIFIYEEAKAVQTNSVQCKKKSDFGGYPFIFNVL